MIDEILKQLEGTEAGKLAGQAMAGVDWDGLHERSQATFAKVRDPVALRPPYDPTGYPRAAWAGAKAAGNALVVEPGMELGGALQNIAEGQGGFGDYLNAGMNVAGAVPGGALAKGAAMAGKFVPAMFAGVMAKTADRAALATAERLAAKGAPKEQIWNETGWFKGADDKWRFEIPDNAAQLNPNEYANGLPKAKDAIRSPAAGQLWHPDLYEAYPDARNIDMKVQSGNSGTYWERGGEKNAPMIDVKARKPSEGTSIGVHEMQHHVQAREGFAEGGDPAYLRNQIQNPQAAVYEDALKNDPRLAKLKELENSDAYYAEIRAKNAIYEEKYKPRLAVFEGNTSATAKRKVQEIFNEAINDQYGKYPLIQQRSDLIGQLQKDDIPFYQPEKFLTGDTVYRRLAGEVEARNVQKRKDYTPEQRKAEPPWATEDVPSEQQIVRGVRAARPMSVLDIRRMELSGK